MGQMRKGYENSGFGFGGDPTEEFARAEEAGNAQYSGTTVHDGFGAEWVKHHEFGHDKFRGRGDGARYDEDRISRGGRHYGRSGNEVPGPGAERGALQRREAFHREAMEDAGERRADGDEDAVPSRTQRWRPGWPAPPVYEPRRVWSGGAPPRVERRGWQRTDLRAGDVMSRPRVARPEDPVQRVARVMHEDDVGLVPVVDGDGRLLGVVTQGDLVGRVLTRAPGATATRVADVMTDDVDVATPDYTLHEVLQHMARQRVWRLPVVARGDVLVGVITMGDIAREAVLDAELQATFADIAGHRGFWSRGR